MASWSTVIGLCCVSSLLGFLLASLSAVTSQVSPSPAEELDFQDKSSLS